MTSEYKEGLSTGGTICITQNSWYIQYYFSEPNYRYHGTFVTIPGDDIDAFIHAYKNNFDKYLLLKRMLPKGSLFEIAGEMGMNIRIGGGSEGVCIKSHHMPISTKDQLNRVMIDYANAKKRATLVQGKLRIFRPAH